MTFFLTALGVYFLAGIVFASSLWMLDRLGALPAGDEEPDPYWVLPWIACWPLLGLILVVWVLDSFRDSKE